MEVVKATFPTDTKEGLTKIFNATSGASIPLRNAVGEKVEIDDILIYSDIVTGFGNEPTEQKLVAFFAKDGKVFAGVSAVATNSADSLADMMSNNEGLKPTITFTTGKSNGGQAYVNIQLISL